MIKALSAIAVAAFIAAALSILPGFAPQVEASVPQALAKGDRLDIQPVGRNCSEQAWPNFEASCLRVAGARIRIRQARLVTADRSPKAPARRSALKPIPRQFPPCRRRLAVGPPAPAAPPAAGPGLEA